MHALSASVVLEFCKICSWAYEVWLNHRELFDHNPREAELQKSLAGDALARLSVISQEYALLQIVKLHDRAVVSGNVTLSIDYIVRYGGWSDSIRVHLDGLASELKELASQLRDARNKSLSHNDLANIVAGATLGAFAQGADDRYFDILQKFVNTVHELVIGGPWPFDDRVKNDVAAFLVTVKP
jgi:hypothetical protein